MNRARFVASVLSMPVGLAASPGAATAQAAAGQTTVDGVPDRTGRGALILGGGGARGAYEAGIIEGLRRAAGVSDGQKLPGIDVVVGTSIGTLNGWFVATGQYSRLAEIWRTIGKDRVFEVKRKFSALVHPGAFVLTKIIQALSLAQGLTTNVRGILDGGAIARWLDAHIDLSAPMLIPYVFTVTNLDRERAELFYRLPFVATETARLAVLARLQNSVGTSVVIREATDDIVKTAMRASAAIPVLFDPVEFAPPEGGIDRYVDGGVADNNPVDVGRALARSIYAVVLDPEHPARQPYTNALAIGVGAFGVAQRRVLDASLRSAYFETRGLRLFPTSATTPAQRQFVTQVLDVDLFLRAPASELDVEVAEFDRQEKIDATYARGLADIAQGWQPYVPTCSPGPCAL